MLRRAAFCLGMALLVAMPARAQQGPQQPSLEYQVKGAYLAKLAPFVDWPADAFADAAAPLVICVVGRDPFGAALDRAVDGVRDRNHPLTVRRLAEPDPASACHILYVGDAALVPAVMEQTRGRPVLTVTDSGQPARGIISFVIAGNNVRFDIDAALAQNVGLTLSSKLLNLARNVRRSIR